MDRADLVVRNGRLITLDDGPTGVRRGGDMRKLGIVPCGDVAIRGERLRYVGEHFDGMGEREIDAQQRIVLPGFVDCHTHACWAGDRYDEFELKQAGASYLDILKAGGGIMSTVRATRDADEAMLHANTVRRLERMLATGTTVAEVKSGYGLETDTELRMLRVISGLGRSPHSQATQRDQSSAAHMHIVPTFLGAHAIDGERGAFVRQTIEHALPAVVAEFGPVCCDAYCEDGAWSLEETRRLFEAAKALGCPLRIHTDQFHSLGATSLAVSMGAVSVDHLEASTENDIKLVAGSDTVAVCLPISGFQTDGRYAPGRALIDAGAAVALATNYNPGSAPSGSMPLAMALAVRKLNWTPAEALCAATVNGAAVLGLGGQSGRLSVGATADVVIWDEHDERALCYELAHPGADVVIANGRVVRDSQPT